MNFNGCISNNILKLKQESKKNVFDNLYTPKGVTKPLIDFLEEEIFQDTETNKYIGIWECCDYGGSFISKDFKERGYDVFSSGIDEGSLFKHDYLLGNTDLLNDVCERFIVTNPPYSLKDKFLEKAIEDLNNGFIKGFAFLLPLSSLACVKRNELFNEATIAYDMDLDVLVFDKRIDFTGKGANYFDVAWFVFYPNAGIKKLHFINYEKE